MSGWKRTSHGETVKTKAFWLRYGLCLAQVLVVVAYFLPWKRTYANLCYPGLLEWLYPMLVDGPSVGLTFYMAAALSVCIMATIICLLLCMFVIAKRGEHAVALRASSMLNSLALAGPLLYMHGELAWPIGSADPSVLWSALGEMAIGWFIALFAGSAASLLTLYMYHEACRSDEGNHESIRRSSARSHTTSLHWVSILIVVIGCAVTVTGFFLTWNSGSALSIYGQSSYSNIGFDVSPLMYLVPVAAILSTALIILSLFVSMAGSPVTLQFAQNLLIVTLALTLFWGLAFGEYRHMTVSSVFIAKVQLGWYLCVIGQSIVLAVLFLRQRIWFAMSNDQIA